MRGTGHRPQATRDERPSTDMQRRASRAMSKTRSSCDAHHHHHHSTIIISTIAYNLNRDKVPFPRHPIHATTPTRDSNRLKPRPANHFGSGAADAGIVVDLTGSDRISQIETGVFVPAPWVVIRADRRDVTAAVGWRIRYWRSATCLNVKPAVYIYIGKPSRVNERGCSLVSSSH